MADLALIQTFVTVYRVGSMTAAARLLHVSQPAVSKQIQAFEAQSQRALFVRHAHGIAPTAAAHALAEQLAPHVDAVEASLVALAVGAESLAGTVLLGGPAELLGVAMLPALRPAVDHAIAVHAHEGMPPDLLDALGKGALDLAVVTQRTPTRGIRFHALFSEEFLLVGAPEWARRLPPSAIAERGASLFADVPILAYDTSMPIVRRFWRDVFRAPAPKRVAVVVPNLRSVTSAAVAGLGVTVLPRYLITEALQRAHLISLYPEAPSPTNTLWLATRVGHNSPRVAFVAALLRRAASLW